MMDEFYLPEDILEWIGLKKSEYLSKLIENSHPDDFHFHEYMSYEELIPSTLSRPDWSVDEVSDGRKIKVFVRNYFKEFAFMQVVIGVLVPDQENLDVFVPILALVTKKEEVVQIFAHNKRLLKH